MKETLGSALNNYVLTERTRDFALKAELPYYVTKDELFWTWRYQKSVMDLAWTTVDGLDQKPGHIVAAELVGDNPSHARIEFTLLPPPVEVGDCLYREGEETSPYFKEWGSIFRNHDEVIIFYWSADRRIKYLRVRQKVAFDAHLAAPLEIPATTSTRMPTLMKVKPLGAADGRGAYPWAWAWSISVNRP